MSKIKAVNAALTHAVLAGVIVLAFLNAEAARRLPDTPTAAAPLKPAAAAKTPAPKPAPPADAPAVPAAPFPALQPPGAVEPLQPDDMGGAPVLNRDEASPADSVETGGRDEAQTALTPGFGAGRLDNPQPQPVARNDAVHARLLDRIAAAYPGAIRGHDGRRVIFHDGSTMPFDDGRAKTPGERLELADLEDQFFDVYPPGREGLRPPEDFNPGRVLHEPFFRKIYGDCKAGEVERQLREIIWLPKNWGQTVKITAANGAAEQLARISEELDALPPRFMRYVKPGRGGALGPSYDCREIPGTSRMGMHAFGAAFDIVTRYGDVWQDGGARKTYRNRIPLEIVEIFEKHGFIWGGKWRHFETAHFEYRPELLPGALKPDLEGIKQPPPIVKETAPNATPPASDPPPLLETVGPPLPLPQRQPRNIR